MEIPQYIKRHNRRRTCSGWLTAEESLVQRFSAARRQASVFLARCCQERNQEGQQPACVD